MNPLSENALSNDPDLDENRSLTPNPNENQYVEDPELLDYLRSLMGKSPIPDPSLTSELIDTGTNYMNSPKFKIMVTEMANPNCFDSRSLLIRIQIHRQLMPRLTLIR
jgi:hypothetical protein